MSQYNDYYTENDMEPYRELSEDSFLAGILFCKNEVDYIKEYSKLKEDFEKQYKVEMVGGRQENLNLNIVVEGTNIKLVDDYDKIICVNGKYIDVRSYLYSLTSDEVRKYFGLQQQKQDLFKKYWKYLFVRKGRRK